MSEKVKKRIRLGFLIDALDLDFQNRVLNGVKYFCNEAEIDLLIYVGAQEYVQNDRRCQYEVVSKFISHNEIDGILVLSGAITAHYAPTKFIDIIKSIREIPIVSIAVDIPGIISVLVDNEKGISSLFNHLFLDHGCKNIAFVKGPEGHDEADRRFLTYCRCLEESGLPFDPDLVVQGKDFSIESGYNAAALLLKRELHNIDAVMAVDDASARGILNKLKELDIPVPGQMLVTGFDNLENAIYGVPSLTTVSQPFYEQGITAARKLLRLINKIPVADNIKLPINLIIRDSCGCSFADNKQKSDDKINNLPHEYQVKLNNLRELIQPDSGFNYTSDSLKIINRVKKMIRDDYQDLQSLSFWPSVLEQFYLEILSIEGDHFKKQELFRQTMQIFYHFQELNFNRKQISDDSHRYELYFLSHQILSTFNQRDLFNILQTRFPVLNIQSFYLVLYDRKYSLNETLLWKNTPKAELKVAYNSGRNLIADNHLRTLDSDMLLHPDMFIGEEGKSLIFFPLSFNGDHYGYILFNLNTHMMTRHYEMLRISISSALHSCLLMEQLEKSVQQRTDFFINIAHEMKTPVTLISSYLDKYVDCPDNLLDVKVAQENVNKLKRDMTNFLDNEKLEKGKIHYDNHCLLNLCNFITDKVTAFREIASKAGVTIDWEPQCDLYIQADPSAMDRILNNLIDNGIRYNRDDGHLGIKISSSEGRAVLQISNTGTPIDQKQQSRIFEPFYQITRRKHNNQGIGMGLSIVKRIIDQMGGEIVLSSVNDITTFTIYLIPAENDNTKISMENYTYTDPLDTNEIPLIYSPYSPEKKNILLVDDSRQMISFLKKQMNPDYNVYYAFSGNKALEMMRIIPEPDLIISDIMMDDMDGLQYYHQFRELQNNYHIPFLFLSARAGLEARVKALELGAVDFISKPFELQELLFKVKNLIRICHNQKENACNDIKENLLKFFDKQSNTRTINNEDDIKFSKIFSRRELEIIHQLEEGKQYKEIAYNLEISINTVKTYIKRIYKKAEVSNKVELLRLFNWPRTTDHSEQLIE